MASVERRVRWKKRLIRLVGPSPTGTVIAQLAIKGYSVVKFDDRDQGESTHSAYPQPVDCSIPPAGTGQLYGNKGLICELDDLRAVEKVLLVANSENTALNHPWRSIHVVGLSGGGVRAAHFMMISRSPVLSSTYIATLDPRILDAIRKLFDSGCFLPPRTVQIRLWPSLMEIATISHFYQTSRTQTSCLPD
jgi:hypothetical protein